jgi:hypothetical protein
VDPKLKCKKCSGKKVNRERKILGVSFMDPFKKRNGREREKNGDVVTKHVLARVSCRRGGGG